jgi:DNA-binding NtrC family response regulator
MTLYGPLTAQNYLRLLRRLLNSVPDRRFFDEVLDGLIGTVEAERGFLLRLSPSGDFRVFASRTHDRESISGAADAISHFAIRRMLDDSEPFHLFVDTHRDRRFRTESGQDGRRAVCVLMGRLERSGDADILFYLDHRFKNLEFNEHHRTSLDHWIVLLGLALRIQEEARAARKGSLTVANRAPLADPPKLLEPMEPVKPVEFHGIWTSSRKMSECLTTIRRLASTEIPVLVVGETGTGKGLAAEAIHRASLRAEKPFCSVNCAAIPEALLESELFGHVRGAFTGAEVDRIGLVAQAEGGTLFLDEVADMSEGMQAKLLRFLESGIFRPLGQKSESRGDVRIVSATQMDLERHVEDGKFRSDLYYRLCGMCLRLPPLRQRREDVPGLADRFLDQYSREQNVSAPELDDAAAEWVLRYSWPGNVRELQNILRQFVALGVRTIREADFNAVVWQGWDRSVQGSGPSLEDVVAKAECEAIVRAMGQSAGNKSKAADFLGITRKALYRRLVKYNLIDIRGEPSHSDGDSDGDYSDGTDDSPSDA